MPWAGQASGRDLRTSCQDLGNCADEPLIALGVLSAATYACRRESIRSSWGVYPEVTSGEVLLRFLSAIAPAPSAALEAEQREYGDIVMLQTNVTSRNVGPMLTVFRWLWYATTTPPYSKASYVAKLDDDGTVWVPEMVRHLRLLRNKPNVYYGIYYWSSWNLYNYRVAASGYTPQSVSKGAGACMRTQNCSSPFPFAAAPIQLISSDLASALAASPRAIAYTEAGREVLTHPRRMRTFAAEDTFLGFALHDLLPEGFTGITTARIDRYKYTFDSWGSIMKNTTVFYHDRIKSRLRMRAAYLYTLEHSCPTNVSIRCGRRNERHRISEQCSLSPANKTCRVKNLDLKRSVYFKCDMYSAAKKREHNLTETCKQYEEPPSIVAKRKELRCK